MILKKIIFWMAEALLLLAAGFFAYAMVGYSTIALMLCGVAAIIALYRIIGCYARRNAVAGKRLRRILTVLVIAGFVMLCAVEIPIIASSKTDDDAKAEYLIVLGAGVNGTAPSLTLINRLTSALEYLEEYPQTKVVVSGGQGPGEDITEAECMRRWLESRGVDPERILIEDKSTSTYENLLFSLEVIESDGGDPEGRLAIASNDYHLYRAKYIARQLGAEPLGVAAKTPYVVLTLNYYIREAFAVLAMWVM